MKKENISRARRHVLGACFGMLAFALPPLTAHAQPELFPSTEVTAHYNPIAWLVTATRRRPAATPEETAIFAIEPAAGHESPPAEAEKSPEAETPHATGKTEGAKGFNGKVIGAPPPLPKVTIGGQLVVTRETANAAQMKEITPEKLRPREVQEMLNRRLQVSPYVHDPQQILHAAQLKSNQAPDGIFHPSLAAQAPIKVVEFIDLSCGQCMAEVAKIDAAMQDISSTILITHVHAPLGQFQDTNMPAFYGKVADRAGVFWQYRAAMVQDKPADAAAMFDELVKSGVEIATARNLMLTEARRFYRELDADALLARSFGIGRPPVVFVNGIRLGENGLPLDLLPDVLNYVQARLQHNIPEPPQ